MMGRLGQNLEIKMNVAQYPWTSGMRTMLAETKLNRAQRPTCKRVGWMLALLLSLITFGSRTAEAQRQFNPFPSISLNGLDPSEPVTLSADFSYSDSTSGVLNVVAELARDRYVYSVTQEPGGPLPTKITLAGPPSVRLTGAFEPDQPPSKKKSKIYSGLTVEEHRDIVTWSAPIEFPAGFTGEITIDVDCQVCAPSGSCVPIEQTLTAAPIQPPPNPATQATNGAAKSGDKKAGKDSAGVFRAEDSAVEWIGKSSASAKPGSRARAAADREA